MYVSVTGLGVRKGQALRFWWHALRSMAQAKRAPGNIFADARTREGIQHTLTVWEDRAAMRAYIKRGAHLQAMRAFGRIDHGKTVGYEAEAVPDWTMALAIWDAEAREI